MVCLATVAVTGGNGFTIIPTVWVDEHKPVEPVTEQVVGTEGDTLMEFVVAPVFHKQLAAAPLAIMFTVLPWQTVLEPVTAKVAMKTGKITTVVLWQPEPTQVPVTVQLVLTLGLTPMLGVVAPVFQI